MKVKKKLLSIAIIMCMTIMLFPLSVFAQSSLVWPVPGHTNLSQGFHNGNAIDISDGSIYGANVVAAMGGTVTHIWLYDCHHDNQSEADAHCYGFGTGIVIQGDDGRIYQYAHMLPGSVPGNVYRGAYISAGQKIGQVGNSGFSTGTHLHFGISIGNYWNASGINPQNEQYTYDVPPATVSLNWSNISASPSNNNAAIHAEADTNVSGSFTEAGITVWNEAGQVVGEKSEVSGVKGTHINIDYDLANEVGAKLESGANYTFQIYTVFNGTRYETGVGNFRTTGPSANAWTQELSIENWTYGNKVNTPTATAKYGQIVYSYSDDRNGKFTSEVPQNAGTYYVKASVAATGQYTGLEAIKEFTIYKAIPLYEVPENVTAIYGQTLADVSLPEGFVWEDDTEKVGNVGETSFMASYVPEDTSNYEVIDKIEIAVTVNPKDMSGIDLSGIDKNTDLDKYEIKDGDVVLVKDQDYKISTVKDGNKVTVKVEFMGNYTGTAETSYLLNVANNVEDKNGKEVTTGSVKTGDTTDIAMWLVLVALAGGAMVITIRKKTAVK